MTNTNETVYALSTPPGRGALAVVRVSGPAAADSIKILTKKPAPEPRRATLRDIYGPGSGETDGLRIDKGVVIFFKGPASYTGEDVAEYHIHGGVAVIKALLAALENIDGARPAEPGEFTRRAFENGRMDLTESEAVADLIDAETEAQRLQALSQLEGSLSRLYGDWRERLSMALAYLEADLDFSDEELPEDLSSRARAELHDIAGEIAAHLNDNRRGERLRNGIHIAVVGAPNAGKSSLVNALAQREAAIVSDIAGTTRDVIDVHLDLGGYPVIISDTAGLRPLQTDARGHEAIEREGMRRALSRAGEADIKLLLFDAACLPEMDEGTLGLRDETSLMVVNKADLAHKPVPEKHLSPDTLLVSAKTGEGLSTLTNELVRKISAMLGSREAPSLTRARHRKALENCMACLERSFSAELPELASEDVRLAMRELGRITGRVDVEELLDIIFRDFCLGK